MNEIRFKALVKKVTGKALASLDKGFEVVLQGDDPCMIKLMCAPADEMVEITVNFDNTQEDR